MRVLQVIPTLNPAAGGPVEGLTQQGIEMVRSGHSVHTLSLDRPGTPWDRRIASSAVYLLGPRYTGYGYAPRLESWLREHGRNYDVIVVHGMWMYHGYCVAKVARDLGLRYVVFLHGMLDPWFARQFPIKHIKKWMYWTWAEYRMLRDASMVLFTSAEEMSLARQSFWLYKVRERLVGYGIRTPDANAAEVRATFLRAFPHLTGKRSILYLSRIHPKKGCDLLIQAFAKVAKIDPDLHLVMAGPGEEAWIARLRELVSQLGLIDRVTFTGMLKDSMKWGAYNVAEVFALPSHQENFGIAVAEALACGLPVLTTRQVNIWREIEEAHAGIIHTDTQSGVDRLLSDWLALGEPDKEAMRIRAKECFDNHFEIRQVAQNLLDALAQAIGPQLPAHTFRGAFLTAVGARD